MALLENITRRATVRAAQDGPVEVVALNRELFAEILSESEETHRMLRQIADERGQRIEEAR
jgi:CRP-like cAMP-binding protein